MKRNHFHLTLLPVLLLCLSCSPATVKDHGVFAPSRTAAVQGQDGVSSIPFSDDLWLWTFGDTIVSTPDGKTTMHANSLGFTPAPDRRSIRKLPFTWYSENGRIIPFIRTDENEDPRRDRLWALDGIRLGDRVYVYFLHIIVHSQKTWDFSLQSVDLARWDVPAGWHPGEPVNFRRLGTVFTDSPPAFGASVTEQDGFLYITGQYKAEGFSSPIMIARVPVEGIEDPSAYTYLTRNGNWTSRRSEGRGFLGDVAGECSLAYDAGTACWRIIHCRLFTGEIVMTRFSAFKDLSKAQGTVIYTAPALDEGETAMWYYSAKEIFTSGDSIFAIYINPKEYQPHLLEIPSR